MEASASVAGQTAFVVVAVSTVERNSIFGHLGSLGGVGIRGGPDSLQGWVFSDWVMVRILGGDFYDQISVLLYCKKVCCGSNLFNVSSLIKMSRVLVSI